MMRGAVVRRGTGGFTLVEILVAVAILAIVFGLMIKPLLMGIEVLSVGRAEKQAQNAAQAVANQVKSDLETAVAVYSGFNAFDLATGGSATGWWRTPQLERLSLVPAARDAAGRLLTPIQPAKDAAGRPQVVAYWAMRHDLGQPYDYIRNPRQAWRATFYHDPYVETIGGTTLTVSTPDDFYTYALRKLALGGGAANLAAFGPLVAPVFARGGAFDWYVTTTDRSYASTPTAGARLMRSPFPLAAGVQDVYTNATTITAVTALTDQGTDVRELQFMPVRTDLEQLRPNKSFTAYRGALGRWQEPYQRGSDGLGLGPLWTLPSTGIVSAASGAMPLVGMIRCAGDRNGTPLNGQYFLSVDQDPASPRVGHTLLYRLPASAGGQAVPVYDCTDYPKRVFGCAPGALSTNPGDPLSGEMACGITWESGEITTAFPAQDIIVPDSTGAAAAVVALNNYDWSGMPANPPLFTPGTTAPTAVWQSLPLTTQGAPGANGSEIDDDARATGATGGPYRWTAYTLSAFRPERLFTGGLGGLTAAQRQLNMSVVPGSVKVVVEQGYLDAGAANAWRALSSRVYTAVDSKVPGAAGGLGPYRYYLDPSSGQLAFYDPQLVGDASTARDGFNPPEDLNRTVTVNGASVQVRTIIKVTYESRNNLPTVGQILVGNDANRDVVEMTYRSWQSLDVRLTVDVATDSTRGEPEVIGDPADPAAATLERPTGARRRVVITQRVTVGSAAR